MKASMADTFYIKQTCWPSSTITRGQGLSPKPESTRVHCSRSKSSYSSAPLLEPRLTATLTSRPYPAPNVTMSCLTQSRSSSDEAQLPAVNNGQIKFVGSCDISEHSSRIHRMAVCTRESDVDVPRISVRSDISTMYRYAESPIWCESAHPYNGYLG